MREGQLDVSDLEERSVDCDIGRELGCSTFCCRLIVRLAPGEREPGAEGRSDKHCVDKDLKSGWCVHLEPTTHACKVWSGRPRVCREYDCNTDPLLQVVLEHGFVDLTTLVKSRRTSTSPVRRVPYRHGKDG
jgi:hypothetical protein